MATAPMHALVRHVPHSYVTYYANKGKTVVAARAEEQHQDYVRALEATGLAVAFVDPDETLPDCVFIEDTAVVWNGHVLITRTCQHRAGEPAAVAAVLGRSHVIAHLPSDATLDGGDVLHADDVTYVGLSTRTNEAGAAGLAAFLAQLGPRVVQIPVAHCLHLKTGITYLGDGAFIAVPGWLDLRLFEANEVIPTAAGESGAANCLRIHDLLLIPDGYPATAARLQRFAAARGLTVQRLAISEFEKGDGSLTCLALIW